MKISCAVFYSYYNLSTGAEIAQSIATGYKLDDRRVGVRVPVGSIIFSSHIVKTGSGSHTASDSTGNGGSFQGSKTAGA
jgi:hypothetical protein